MARIRALAAACMIWSSLAVGAAAIAAGTTAAPAAAADPSGAPKVSVRAASVVEGAEERRFVRFAVVLSWRSTQPVSVQYATHNGTASAGFDYRAKAGTLTFLPGQFVKYVGVTIWPDLREEGDETFSFTLTSPVNATLGAGSAVATIIDDEPHIGARVSIGDGAITEMCTKNVAVPLVVTLEGPSPLSTVRVRTVAGTARATSDFVPLDKTISFAAGVVAKEVRIPIVADGPGNGAGEGAEQFTVTISVVSGPVTVQRGTATVTVADCPT